MAFCDRCLQIPCSSSKTHCEHVQVPHFFETRNANEIAPEKRKPCDKICNSDDSSPNILKIGSLNVCGLKTRSKFPDFVEAVKMFDILCVQETKLDQYDLVSVPDYSFLSKPRQEKYKRKSGGLGFFVNNNLKKMFNLTTLESNCEYVYWLNVCDGIDSYVIGNIYIPPEKSRFYNDDELFSLETEITSKCLQYDKLILTGDTNSYTSNLPDYTIIDNFLCDHCHLEENTVTM